MPDRDSFIALFLFFVVAPLCGLTVFDMWRPIWAWFKNHAK